MSPAKDAYDRSRYEAAKRDVRQEIEREFNESAPVKVMELAERFVVAIEAIARAMGGVPAVIPPTKQEP